MSKPYYLPPQPKSPAIPRIAVDETDAVLDERKATQALLKQIESATPVNSQAGPQQQSSYLQRLADEKRQQQFRDRGF